jgi:hypothetical protein
MPLLTYAQYSSLASSGSNDDKLFQFLRANYSGTLDDMFRAYLSSTGLSGSVQDMIGQWDGTFGATRGLGWNTGVFTAVSSNRPFINLVKQANNWTADNAASYTANSDGYPTAMEGGATYYESYINLGAEETSFRSRWRLTWEGDGTMAAGSNTNSATTIDSNTIEFTPDSITNNLKIYWNITGFGTTGISNVAVVRTDRADLYDAGNVYEPVWLERLSAGGQTRYLNWLNINSSNTAPTLAGRASTSHYNYGDMPVEVLVDICNQSNSDLWILMNHQAPQDLVEYEAAYIRDNLNSGLKTLFEVSNEPWNSAFGQTEYYYARGLEYFRGTAMAGTMSTTKGSSIVSGSGTSFTTELAVNDLVGIDGQFFIVNSVDSDTQFTSDGNRTATKTGSGFDGYYGSEYDHVDAYVYEATIKRDWFDAIHSTDVEYILNAQYASTTGVSSLIDAAIWLANTPSGGTAWSARNLKWDRIAIGLYFGGGIISDSVKVAALQALLDVSDDAGVSALVDTYLNLDESGGLPFILDRLRLHDRACKAASMSLDVYEEGPHISHSTGSSSASDEQTVLDAQTVWRKSDECTTFMAALLLIHKAFINGRYNHFDLHHGPSSSGDWGAYRLIDDPDAATDKMVEFLLDIPTESVWYGDRAPIAIVDLPDIVQDEFDTITAIETDHRFSANATSYSASLPTGLSIDSVTGEITGTLVDGSNGVGTYTVTATNSSGSVTASGDYNITDITTASPGDASYNGVAWIDTSDLSTQSISGTDVTDITDKINAQVYIASSGKYPQATGSINGNDVWTTYNKYTSGTHDTTVNTITEDFTLYFVHKGGIASVGEGNAFFFGGVNWIFSLELNSTGNQTFNLKTINDGAIDVTVTPSGALTDTYLTVVKYDGTNLTIDANGDTASQAATGNIDWGTPSAFMRLGAGTGTNYIRSEWAELLICDSAHDAGQVSLMSDYFTTKYGIA